MNSSTAVLSSTLRGDAMSRAVKISPEQAIILCFCSQMLHLQKSKEHSEEIPTPLDWNFVRFLALRHGIAGMALKAIDQKAWNSCIPPDILGDFRNAYRTTAFKNALLLKEYTIVAQAFNAANIDFMPLKGISFLGSLYGEIGLRPCGDMDILVADSVLQQAGHILIANGYKKKREPRNIRSKHFHSVYSKEHKFFTVVLELHWDIERPGSIYAIKIEEIFKRATEISQNGYVCRHPSLEDSILLNCIHLARSLSSGKIMPLKNFIDVATIIAKNFSAINWPALHERSEKYRVVRPVFLVLLMVELFFHLHIPLPLWSTLERKGLGHEHIETIVNERIFFQPQVATNLPNAFLRLVGRQTPDAKRGNIIQHMSRVACNVFKREYYTMRDQGVIAIGTKGLRKTAVALKNNISSLALFIFRRTSMQQRIQCEQGKKDSIGTINKWLKDA